ncbi:hypothetical protein PR048_029989 [Dryococelus australis]|uniref:Gamma-tubulin complex component n=1 Tax=Dryococelus australis TaxID=614101 RepID=A0ABQ9G7P4_9NEOP|nr:hypothetical protein PR048_029989 [Dryococelus australis]
MTVWIRSRLSKAVNDIQQKLSPSKNEHEERKINPLTYRISGLPSVTVLQPKFILDFSDGTTQASFPSLLGPVPISSQESFLLEDLLCCLEGIEGHYITPKPLDSNYAHRRFDISSSIDPSLRQLVEQILQLASYYSLVSRFIEEKSMFVWGQVNQALAAAMNALIRDYLILVAQLETLVQQGGFTLHKMWFYIQPTLLSMKILADTANRINMAQATGGKVLSLLHEQTSNYIGDSKGQDLCFYLIQSASVPYMEILEKWICKGVICDPYAEFLVEDNEIIQKEDMPPVDYSADYWEKRYTIRKERIPVFLDVVSKSILRTGKYLNVIRQCGKNVKMPQDLNIVYTIKERRYIEAINSAYLFASKTLLQLLMEENDLLGRLRSVKHYFLLDQGDFIVQFMDCCETELCQNVDSVQSNRLAPLLELALRTSGANSDPYKDDMAQNCSRTTSRKLLKTIYTLAPGTRSAVATESRISLVDCPNMWVSSVKDQSPQTPGSTSSSTRKYKKHTDQSNLSGMKFFSFAYEVKWPVSLVLNRKAISCYQMIFRHLFYCKHVERLLCRLWISNKIGKTFQKNNAKMYVPAFALRQRMLTCIQNLEYYMMVEVIEPNWVSFLDKISKVSNVDDVLVCHSDFLDSCLKDCMLMSAELLDTVNALLALCEQFCKFMQYIIRVLRNSTVYHTITPEFNFSTYIYHKVGRELQIAVALVGEVRDQPHKINYRMIQKAPYIGVNKIVPFITHKESDI